MADRACARLACFRRHLMPFLLGRKPAASLRTIAALVLFISALLTQAQTGPRLAQGTREAIDRRVQQTLAKTGVPSASIAVVKDGQIAYVRAYGNATVQPQVTARPEMRYSIGSISKQFTASAIL